MEHCAGDVKIETVGEEALDVIVKLHTVLSSRLKVESIQKSFVATCFAKSVSRRASWHVQLPQILAGKSRAGKSGQNGGENKKDDNDDDDDEEEEEEEEEEEKGE